MFQSLAKFGVRKIVASNDHLDIQHAAILHIDIVGSSQQVQKNLLRAHRQIQSLYNRLAVICSKYGGITRELRGDAALFEFSNATDAVLSAGAIHKAILLSNSTRMGYLSPAVRTGLSYGPVVHSNNMLTGEAVIRAQRIEQLAVSGQVLFDQYLAEKISVCDLPDFDVVEHSRQTLKGFTFDTIIHEALFKRPVPNPELPQRACARVV
jgi:class 3 adenylate cyclase